MNIEQIKQLIADTPTPDLQRTRWVIVDDDLGPDTEEICKLAYGSGKRIHITIHSAHKFGSPEFEAFRADAHDKPWLTNVELIHEHNRRIGEHHDDSLHVAILQGPHHHAEWRVKVKSHGGTILFKRQ